jgi:hypothetical protein
MNIGTYGLGLLAAICAAAPVGQGRSLASRHPGDAGIGGHPSVLLHEDFETAGVRELARRWTEISNQADAVLALTSGGPDGSRRCLQVTATLGKDTGGHLYRKLPRECDTLYARFYVRFAEDAPYIHHFVHLGGYRPATNWPQGGAGERPNGDERITVGIEPHGVNGRYAAPGVWTFYAYWHEMKRSADGRYWGNSIRSDTPAVVPKGRWQCVEVMLKLNSVPDRADGELALWLDGKPAYRIGPGTPRGAWTGMGFETKSGGEAFEGFRWRRSADLRLNFFWLMHYVTENAARQNNVASPKPVNRVWFDDIVVATEYIGPKAPATSPRS